MKIKIFCDTADLKTIKKLNKNPLVSGFTTNPSLMRLAGAKDYKNYSLKLLQAGLQEVQDNAMAQDTLSSHVSLTIEDLLLFWL